MSVVKKLQTGGPLETTDNDIEKRLYDFAKKKMTSKAQLIAEDLIPEISKLYKEGKITLNGDNWTVIGREDLSGSKSSQVETNWLGKLKPDKKSVISALITELSPDIKPKEIPLPENMGITRSISPFNLSETQLDEITKQENKQQALEKLFGFANVHLGNYLTESQLPENVKKFTYTPTKYPKIIDLSQFSEMGWNLPEDFTINLDKIFNIKDFNKEYSALNQGVAPTDYQRQFFQNWISDPNKSGLVKPEYIEGLKKWLNYNWTEKPVQTGTQSTNVQPTQASNITPANTIIEGVGKPPKNANETANYIIQAANTEHDLDAGKVQEMIYILKHPEEKLVSDEVYQLLLATYENLVSSKKQGGIIKAKDGDKLPSLEEYKKKLESTKVKVANNPTFYNLINKKGLDVDEAAKVVSVAGDIASVIPGIGAIGGAVSTVSDLVGDITYANKDGNVTAEEAKNIAINAATNLIFTGAAFFGLGAAKSLFKAGKLAKVVDTAIDAKKITKSSDELKAIAGSIGDSVTPKTLLEGITKSTATPEVKKELVKEVKGLIKTTVGKTNLLQAKGLPNWLQSNKTQWVVGGGLAANSLVDLGSKIKNKEDIELDDLSGATNVAALLSGKKYFKNKIKGLTQSDKKHFIETIDNSDVKSLQEYVGKLPSKSWNIFKQNEKFNKDLAALFTDVKSAKPIYSIPKFVYKDGGILKMQKPANTIPSRLEWYQQQYKVKPISPKETPKYTWTFDSTGFHKVPLISSEKVPLTAIKNNRIQHSYEPESEVQTKSVNTKPTKEGEIISKPITVPEISIPDIYSVPDIEIKDQLEIKNSVNSGTGKLINLPKGFSLKDFKLDKTDLANAFLLSSALQANKRNLQLTNQAIAEQFGAKKSLIPYQNLRIAPKSSLLAEDEAAKQRVIAGNVARNISDIDKSLAYKLAANKNINDYLFKAKLADQQAIEEGIRQQQDINFKTNQYNLGVTDQNKEIAAGLMSKFPQAAINKNLANLQTIDQFINAMAINQKEKEARKSAQTLIDLTESPEAKSLQNRYTSLNNKIKQAQLKFEQDKKATGSSVAEGEFEKSSIGISLAKEKEDLERDFSIYRDKINAIQRRMSYGIPIKASGGTLSDKIYLQNLKHSQKKELEMLKEHYKRMLKSDEMLLKSLIKIFK